MRIVGEYLAKVAVFDALSAMDRDPEAKKHYTDLARYYRELAQERQWQLATQALDTVIPVADAPALADSCADWPAPGSEDTELGVLMELEVGHGEAEVYA